MRDGWIAAVLASATLVSAQAHAQEAWPSLSLTSDSALALDAYGTNNRGHVVGLRPAPVGSTAFFWTAEFGTSDLPFAAAHDVNDADVVVGHQYTVGSHLPDRFHPVRWTRTNGLVSLGHLGGVDGSAQRVNNAGHIVGYSRLAGGRRHAFVWTAQTGMIDLGTFGGPESVAEDINNAGAIVGSAQTAAGVYRAFLKMPTGPMTDLGTLGGLESHAYGLNDHGQVVGKSQTVNGVFHAFVWTAAGGMVDLGTLGGFESEATSINVAGQVVGSSTVRTGFSERRAFAWQPGSHLIDLETAVTARAINDQGQAVGSQYMWSRVGWKHLAVDFGSPHGIWLRQPGSQWTQIHLAGSANMVSANFDGREVDDLFIDFGPNDGVWAYLNRDTWEQVHPLSPREMVTVDRSGEGLDEVVFEFPGWGIWSYDRFGQWYQVSTTGNHLAVGELDGRPREELIFALPGHGIYADLLGIGVGSVGLVLIHGGAATSITTADLDGNGRDEVVIDFPGYGLWIRYDDRTWTPLNAFGAARIAAGDVDGNGKDDLVIDFGAPFGVWSFENNTTWRPLTTQTTERMLLADLDGNGKDEIVFRFGSTEGLWQLNHLGEWSQLHPLSPGSLAAGRLF